MEDFVVTVTSSDLGGPELHPHEYRLADSGWDEIVTINQEEEEQ